MFRQFLQKILKSLACAALKRHKPLVIAITGTVGKTSAKEAIALVLSKKFSVRKSKKNFNNEIGVPLAILGIESGGSSFFSWAVTLARGFGNAVFARTFPQVLVLEFGVEKPGDMAYLTDFVKLDYAFITALGEVPVHVEFFESHEALWEEKLSIVRGLKPDGVLFYNADDRELAKRAVQATARRLSYGTAEEANIRAENVKKTNAQDGSVGIRCEVFERGMSFQLDLPKLLGTHHASAVLAAVSIGIAFEIPEKELARLLAGYETLPGRMRLFSGVKDSLIIDDTYNASPASVEAALGTVKEFGERRRIAVLGDMLELGSYSDAAHQKTGRLVAASADIFYAVGSRMQFAATEAEKSGMKAVRTFGLSTDAAKPLELELRPGDVVLVKGSQSMRMEKIVEEVMAEPNRAGELLVRQDAAWKEKEVLPV